ncbi:MAG: hypothetical protein Q7S74_00780 [Nanoarchaeota archaeon]|nr:hypothetical protein [Nanoarchaeota archaeon]
MNKGRVMSTFVFALVLSLVMIQVVSAADASAIFDPVKSMFSDWQQGNLSVNIAKYLIFVLLAIFIYGVFDFFPGLKKPGRGPVKAIAAAIVGFLATAYLTPSDVYTTLASYSALGFALSAAIPFAILLFFSIQIAKDGGIGGRIFSKLLWVAFVIFLIWKLLDGMFGITTGTRVISLAEGWGYIGFIIASIAWIFAERRFVRWMFKEEIHAEVDLFKKQIEEQDAKRKTEAKSMENVAGDGI